MHQSLRGHYLIAGNWLRDPNFYKTVVLMVEHNADGAMGLVVNRPSSVTVAHALSEHFNLPETDDLVYVGGPVEPSALFVLHNSKELNDGESSVLPGLYVGANAQVFESVVRQAWEGDPDLKFRIFSGCAGWGPDQLEGELTRGDWYHRPATLDPLFFIDPYEVWDHMVKKVHEVHRIVREVPVNPEWN